MIVLWVSGLTWDILSKIHVIDDLRVEGATITALEPLPITGHWPQVGQMITGQNPGNTGYFDTWAPQQYTSQPVTRPEIALLSKIITAAGRTVISVDLALTYVPSYLNELSASADCLIIRTKVDNDIAIMDKAVKAARFLASADRAFLLLSDQQEAEVKCYVNLNDGLHALGLLEVSTQKTVHWPETLVYHVGHGQLWLNLEGRESAGIITSGNEYDQTCQALIHSLPAKLLDPLTNEPVIERIYCRNEVYSGDYLFQAPDLVVVFRPGYAPSPTSAILGLDGTAV